MNKKGFTLMELLAVIVIISIVSLVVFPAIGTSLTRSKRNTYNKQVNNIENAAKEFLTEHNELADNTHTNDIYISLQSLIDSKYVTYKKLTNPLDKTKMDGCVRISYESNKYNYVYGEKTCSQYATSKTKDIGYIIYTYDSVNKVFEKDSNSNEMQPVGKIIYETYKNVIKVPGETGNGLYEDGDYYYFKGENPNNYLTLLGKNTNSEWRILSINKKDYSLKLINVIPVASNTWNNSNDLEFNSANINNILQGRVNNDIAFDNAKIVNYDFEKGVVKNDNYSIEALRSEISKKTETNVNNQVVQSTTNTSNQKVGSISVLDYVEASTSNECYLNFKSASCAQNNYLKEMFGTTNTVWTMNNNGTNIWYINAGVLELGAPSDNRQIYAVVKLDSNAILTNANGTGTESNQYRVK